VFWGCFGNVRGVFGLVRAVFWHFVLQDNGGFAQKGNKYYTSIAIWVIVNPEKTLLFLLILPHAKNFS